jgi:hypothetical protein
MRNVVRCGVGSDSSFWLSLQPSFASQRAALSSSNRNSVTGAATARPLVYSSSSLSRYPPRITSSFRTIRLMRIRATVRPASTRSKTTATIEEWSTPELIEGYHRQTQSWAFREFQPLCGHLSEDSARFWIGRCLCQLEAMGSIADVSLSEIDRSLACLRHSFVLKADAYL